MDHEDVIGAFSEEQATTLSGVSRAQLRRWDTTTFFIPSLADEQRKAFGRIYSFRDIVALRVLNQLRNVYGISMPELRKTAAALRRLGENVWTAKTLYVHNRRVVFDEPETLKKREITSQQYVADIPLAVAVTSARDAIAALNRRGDDRIGHVVRKRFVVQSAPVLAGTRIPVSAIKAFAAAGFSPAEIVNEYPGLTVADVKAALAYRDGAAAA